MQSKPTISVLLPVYNCEPFLDEALASIRNQSYSDLEIIAVNDGSTDASLQTLQRHAREDERLRIIDQPSGGIVAALNVGLKHCQGVFIARMDGDDVASPERLKKQHRFMQDHPEVGAVGSCAVWTDPEGTEIRRCAYPLDHEAIDNESIRTGNCGILHPTAFMRTDLVREVGGYREYKSAEDYDLFLRLAELSKLANLPETMLRWRRHDGSICARLQPEQAASVYHALHDAAKRRGADYSNQLSTHAYRACWLARDEGRFLTAIRYALKTWSHRPRSSKGPKALLGIAAYLFRRPAALSSPTT